MLILITFDIYRYLQSAAYPEFAYGTGLISLTQYEQLDHLIIECEKEVKEFVAHKDDEYA